MEESKHGTENESPCRDWIALLVGIPSSTLETICSKIETHSSPYEHLQHIGKIDVYIIASVAV